MTNDIESSRPRPWGLRLALALTGVIGLGVHAAHADACTGATCNLSNVSVTPLDPITKPVLVDPSGHVTNRAGTLEVGVTAVGCLPDGIYAAPLEVRFYAQRADGSWSNVLALTTALGMDAIDCQPYDYDASEEYFQVPLDTPEVREWALAMAVDRKGPYDWYVVTTIDPAGASNWDGALDENGAVDTGPSFEEVSDNESYFGMAGLNLIPLSRTVWFNDLFGRLLGDPNTWTYASAACAGGAVVSSGAVLFDPGQGDGQWEPIKLIINAATTPKIGKLCGKPDLTRTTAEGVPLSAYGGAVGSAHAVGVISGFHTEIDFELSMFGATLSAGTLTLPDGVAWHSTKPEIPDDWADELRGFDSPRGATVVPLDLGGDDPSHSFQALYSSRKAFLHPPILLTSEELPFAVYSRGVVVDSSDPNPNRRVRLAGPISVRWLRDPSAAGLAGTFGPIDLGRNRAISRGGRPFGNDVMYSDAIASCVFLNADGLWGSIGFNAGSGHTHFPATDLTWTAEAPPLAVTEDACNADLLSQPERDGLNLIAGQLKEHSASADAHVRVSLFQRTDCPGCSSNDGASNLITIPPAAQAASSFVTMPEGTLVASGAVTSDVEWGPWAKPSSSLHGRTFTHRPDGAAAKIVIPGFKAVGTETAPVVDFLLASFDTMGRASLLGSDPAVRGNGFFAGLTLGPETYRDNAGQAAVAGGANLAGSKLDIVFGGPTTTPSRIEIHTRNAAKYVVRPGGVTGAFNFQSIPLPTVYGFPLALTRFAFTSVNNAGSKQSWVDGQLEVPAWAGFSVPFVSLQLECTGHVGGGVIDRGRLAALPAEKKRLAAWRAPYDLTEVTFVPKPLSADVCAAGDRELSTSGGTTVHSLTKPLDLTAFWTSAGAPSEVNKPKLRGSSVVEFNKPAIVGESSSGFSLDAKQDQVLLARTSDSSYSTAVRGWFEVGGALRLPFWKSPPVTVRLQNKTDGSVGTEHTLVRTPGTPTSTLWAKGNDDATLWAAVTERMPPADADKKAAWTDAKIGSPFPWVFDISFPMRWLPDNTGHPRFVAGGNDPAADLGILKVQANAPETTPRETNIKFGASADMSILSKLTVPTSIDLTSETSIKAIDTFLREVTGVSGACPAPHSLDTGPLWCVLQDLRTPSKFIAGAVGGKFSGLVQGVVSQVFDVALGPVLDRFADLITTLQAAPANLINAGLSQLTGLVDQALAYLTQPMSDGVRKLYEAVPDAIAAAVAQLKPPTGVGVVLPTATRDGLIAACQLLDDEDKCPADSSGKRIAVSFPSALAKVKALQGQATGAVTAVKTALIGTDGSGGAVGTLSANLMKAQCLLGNLRLALGEAPGAVTLPGPCTFPGDATMATLLDAINSAKLGLKLFQCKDGKPDGNEVFKKVTEISSSIDAILKVAESDEIPSIVSGVGGFLGIDMTKFTQALRDVGGYAKSIRGRLNQATTAVNGAFCGVGGGVDKLVLPIRTLLAKLSKPLDDAAKAVGGLAGTITAVAASLDTVTGQIAKKVALADKLAAQLRAALRDRMLVLLDYDQQLRALAENPSAYVDTTAIDTLPKTAAEYRKILDDALVSIESEAGLTAGTLKFVHSDGRTVVDDVVSEVRKPLYAVIANVQTQVGKVFSDLMSQIPFPKKAELRLMLTRLVTESSFVRDLDKVIEQCIRLVLEEVDALAGRLVEQLNQFLREAINKALAVVAKALEGVTAGIKDAVGFSGASLDGYAKIVGNTVQLLQIDARFDSKPSNGSGDEAKRKDEEQSFRASLLMKSWALSDKGKNCLPPAPDGTSNGYGAEAPGDGYLDASISAYDLPFTFGGKGGLRIKELSVGFTLDKTTPIGINGALITAGKLDFKAFSIRDIRFAMGFGKFENYVGASAGASFSGYDMSVAFLVGRMCDGSVLRKIDPTFAGFVKIPGAFEGGYVRGSASVPVFNFGCAFQVGFGADFGAWFLNRAVGGLVGGSVFGNIACLVSVRGTVRLGLTYNTENGSVFFKGQGWCAAGMGFCSPGDWNTVEDSRDDGGLCLTMDALMDAEYETSFQMKKLDVTGPH